MEGIGAIMCIPGETAYMVTDGDLLFYSTNRNVRNVQIETYFCTIVRPSGFGEHRNVIAYFK